VAAWVEINCQRVVVGARARRVPYALMASAKAAAVWEAVKEAKRKGRRSVVVEGESQEITRALSHGDCPPWEASVAVHRVGQMTVVDWESVRFSLVKRRVNVVAHRVTRWMFGNDDRVVASVQDIP